MNIRIAAIAAMTTLMTGAAMAAPASPLFYGYESYNSNEKLGWYSLAADGTTEYLWTDHSGSTGIPMTSGWRRDGKLCGISSLLVEGRLYALNYVELDESNGNVILSQGIEASSTNMLNYYQTACYNPKDNRVYGYGWSADGNEFVLKSSAYDITDTKIVRIVGQEEICSSLTFNEDLGKLIGFNRKSFVSIDPETGYQNVIFTPDVKDFQYTYSALGYDPESGLYYWNMVTNDIKSHLYKVDMDSKTCELVHDYQDMTIFSFLLPANTKGDPLAPAKPEFETANFAEGALEGSVTFKLPTSLVNGDNLSGNLSWTAYIDGESVQNGVAGAGTSVTFESGKLSEGIHNFAMRVASGDKTSRQGVWSGFIGNDTPKAPAGIKLEGTTLTWDAVSTGANGGYVNPADINYTVYLNGENQGTTQETTFTVTYPQGKPYTSYQASVTATFKGKTSEAGISPIVRYGEPIALPVDLGPTLTEADLFDSTDMLGGEARWTYDNSSSGRENFTSPATEGNPVDCWLFMPPVATPDPDDVYEFSIRTALFDAGMSDGTIEVMAGTAPTPEAMTATIISPLSLTQSSLKEFKGLFTPAAIGGTDKVFIGIRAKSASGNYRVFTRRFIVKATDMKATVADAPLMESIEPMPEGELKAKVYFTFPTKLMNGEAIPTGTKMQAIATCDGISTTVDGTPGSKASAEVKTNQGENYITVTSVIDGVKGNYGRIRVFTGMAVPGSVTDFKVDIPADNQSCIVSWNAPTEASGEGYLNPDDVLYYYCTYNSTTGEYAPETNLGKEKSHTIMAPAPERLTNINFAIQSRTNGGASPELVGTRIQLGKPYELPMSEIFYNNMTGKPNLTYSPYTTATSGEYGGTSWQFKDPKEIDAKYANEIPMALIGTGVAGSIGYFQLPKFTTSGYDKAGIELEIYGEEATPAINIWGYSENQSEPIMVGTIENYKSGKYDLYSLQFPESLQNQGWVTIYLTPMYESNANLVISSFMIQKNVGITLPSSDNSRLTVSGENGKLRIRGCEEAEVYTIDGRKVWSGNVENERTLNLNPAIYVVTADGKSVKIIVR